MKEIKLEQIAEVLDAAPIEMATMFIGDTGIGKTQAISQYAAERGIYLKTLILSQLEASEALGIPVQAKRIYNGKEYNTIETAVPTWVFDLAEHENAMLYLDEFLCCEPAVMNSFLNFLTERNVNGIDLHHVKVVAATNIGNYTYEPDNNILSRFCMFYVVNDSFNTYIKNKHKGSKIRIENTYQDMEDREGIIFEIRSLKPRCQEMLYMLKNPDMLDLFYEGYTNMEYRPKFHSNAKLNDFVGEFVVKEDGSWHLKDENIDNVAGLIYKYIRGTKKTADWACKYKKLIYNQIKLQRRVEELLRADNEIDL